MSDILNLIDNALEAHYESINWVPPEAQETLDFVRDVLGVRVTPWQEKVLIHTYWPRP